MIDWYEKVAGYYINGYYTKDQVMIFVEKGKITADQAEAIFLTKDDLEAE